MSGGGDRGAGEEAQVTFAKTAMRKVQPRFYHQQGKSTMTQGSNEGVSEALLIVETCDGKCNGMRER